MRGTGTSRRSTSRRFTKSRGELLRQEGGFERFGGVQALVAKRRGPAVRKDPHGHTAHPSGERGQRKEILNLSIQLLNRVEHQAHGKQKLRQKGSTKWGGKRKECGRGST